MRDTYYYDVEIFYEDTDAAGVVYHANYIKFMERARTTFLREKGLSLPTFINNFKVQFLVRAVNVTYEQPARLQQNITVATTITKYGKASLTFKQDIFFNPQDVKTIICSGEVVIVCTNLQFKPCAIPEAVLRELKE